MDNTKKKNTKVPDGWLQCPNNAKKLILNRFMALKTPLSEDFDFKLSEDDRYHPEDLFKLAARNQVTFGLWIDLTNTDRYYDRNEIEGRNCRYIKFPCQGHGTCPSSRDIKRFLQIIDHFVATNNRDCIAIHCTHGFNRTGFFIVVLLVERFGFNVVEAVQNFAELRPPGIYRHEYIKELYKRYGNGQEVANLPELPPWSKKEKSKYIKNFVKRNLTTEKSSNF